MINVHTELLKQVNHNEMWLLMHLTKRIGKEMTCYPSISTLKKETGFSVAKLYSIFQSLKDKGLISIEQRSNEKRVKQSNLYTIHTSLLGVFVSAKGLKGGISKTEIGVFQKLKGGISKTEIGVFQKLKGGISKTEKEVLSNLSIDQLEVLSNISIKDFDSLSGILKKIKKEELHESEITPPPSSAVPPQIETNPDKSFVLISERQAAKEVNDYLNEVTGKNIKARASVLDPIINRIKEGFQIDDFKLIIDFKWKEWQGCAMEKNMRTITLFGEKHFDNYLDWAKKVKKNPDLLKKQDLKKEKSSAKKEKSQLVSRWSELYKELTGNPYVFDAAGKRERELFELEQNIIKAMEAKKGKQSFSIDDLSDALEYLMKRAYENDWIKQRFSINILNLKFNEIISAQFSGKLNFEDELAKARRTAKKMFS